MSAQTHTHDHAVHDHAHSVSPVRATPGLSLLRMSLVSRLGVAAGFVAAIWLAVFWAIQ